MNYGNDNYFDIVLDQQPYIQVEANTIGPILGWLSELTKHDYFVLSIYDGEPPTIRTIINRISKNENWN